MEMPGSFPGGDDAARRARYDANLAFFAGSQWPIAPGEETPA